MRKEIINSLLLILLITGGIISWIVISQYSTEITNLDQALNSITWKYQEANSEINVLSEELAISKLLNLNNLQIPITGNTDTSLLETELDEAFIQIEFLESQLEQRVMCTQTIDYIKMGSMDIINDYIEEFINSMDENVTGESYWITIWDEYYDITEHGFYGDNGLFWYYLVYQNSFVNGIYSVEDGCWVYSE